MNLNENPPYEIVGVIEDFKMGHLSNPDYPLAFLFLKSRSHESITGLHCAR
ncbi:MAG: hypothetical protein ACLUE2_12400 [Bacteroides cellulosilyticus]